MSGSLLQPLRRPGQDHPAIAIAGVTQREQRPAQASGRFMRNTAWVVSGSRRLRAKITLKPLQGSLLQEGAAFLHSSAIRDLATPLLLGGLFGGQAS